MKAKEMKPMMKQHAKEFFKTGKPPKKPSNMRTSTAAKKSFLKGYK